MTTEHYAGVFYNSKIIFLGTPPRRKEEGNYVLIHPSLRNSLRKTREKFLRSARKRHIRYQLRTLKKLKR